MYGRVPYLPFRWKELKHMRLDLCTLAGILFLALTLFLLILSTFSHFQLFIG